MYKKKYNTNFDFKNKSLYKNIDIDARFNKIQHQFKNSECGVYSINFIIRLLNGKENFDDITNNITNDDVMNSCRKHYFRN